MFGGDYRAAQSSRGAASQVSDGEALAARSGRRVQPRGLPNSYAQHPVGAFLSLVRLDARTHRADESCHLPRLSRLPLNTLDKEMT